MKKNEKVKKALKKAKKEEKKKIPSLDELKKEDLEFKKEAKILLDILKNSKKKISRKKI
jgi:hypothetical protein